MFDHDIWMAYAWCAPHPLEGLDPLPKFKRMPTHPNPKTFAGNALHELIWIGDKVPSRNVPDDIFHIKASQTPRKLDGLLEEDENLSPILGCQGKQRNDIWNFRASGKSVEELLTEVSELGATNETAVASSRLAQAAVQALPLMVLDRQLYYRAGNVWTPIGKNEFILAYEEDPRIRAALQGFNGKGLSDLFERVKLQPSIQRNAADIQMPPSLIPCRDGVFDLDEMRPRKVRSDDYFFSCCDLSVEEIGQGYGDQFETFMAAVAEENAAVRQQVLEMIGTVISGYRPKNFFLLVGPRDTGKSQIMNLLRALIGSEYTMSLSEPNQLADHFISGSLVGKRLCYCPDAARVGLSQKSAATLKQLTGGDLMQANVKYKQPFTFVNEATVVFVSNYPLQLPHDPALESRLVTIPFTTSIPKERQILNFSKLLYQERGYIVGEAICALRDLVDRGFAFTQADSVVQPPMNAFDGSLLDLIVQFVTECCQFDPEGKESNKALYQAFCEFSGQSGCTPLSREVFFQKLNAVCQGLRSFRTAQQRGYQGIKLRT